MHSKELINNLRSKAIEIRKTILKMIYKAQSGHIGGSFSAVEIAICLYYHHLNIDFRNHEWQGRDRIILLFTKR